MRFQVAALRLIYVLLVVVKNLYIALPGSFLRLIFEVSQDKVINVDLEFVEAILKTRNNLENCLNLTSGNNLACTAVCAFKDY